METAISRFLLDLSEHAWIVYAVTFSVAFLESFAFVGLVVPGAVFAVTAGFIAGRGHLSLTILLGCGSLGAILADVASYYLARRWGGSILRLRFLPRQDAYLDRSREFFQRHGGKSVFFGRFVGMVRPVVPFLAGLLRMEPRRFWAYALSSGVLWGVAYIGGGYLFGENWQRFESWTGRLGSVLLIVILVAYFAKPYYRRMLPGGETKPTGTEAVESSLDPDEQRGSGDNP
jgi:membrane protein DedA with SNARE-associated domain